MKSKSKSGFVIENKWVIIGLLVLVLAIVIGIVVLAYYRSGNKTKDSNAIEPFANSSLKYPFDWVIMTKDDNNIFLIDRNNIPSQNKELWHISSGISNKSLEIISNPDTVIKGTLSIPQYGIKLTAANKEFIQILPVIPPQQDTSADYGFVRPTTVGAGFTIAMWVKFPDTRTFNKAGQSECLVEIFKNQKDGKDGAWKSAGSNWGGYFHIVRRANDNGTNNNQIVTGFVGISVVGPKIDDTKWHHIAVSVELTSSFVENSGKYKIALYVDGNKTSQEFTVTDKDQIFMGAEAEFNIGKFTRGISGISNGKQYGYAKMSFTGLQLHNRVLDYYEVLGLAQPNGITKYKWVVENNATGKQSNYFNETNFKLLILKPTINNEAANNYIYANLNNITKCLSLDRNRPNYITFAKNNINIDNTLISSIYKCFSNTFTIIIIVKFNDLNITNTIKTEGILEIYKNGAEKSVTSSTGGYLNICRRRYYDENNKTYLSIGLSATSYMWGPNITNVDKPFFIALTYDTINNKIFLYVNENSFGDLGISKINKIKLDTSTIFTIGYSIINGKSSWLNIYAVELINSVMTADDLKNKYYEYFPEMKPTTTKPSTTQSTTTPTTTKPSTTQSTTTTTTTKPSTTQSTTTTTRPTTTTTTRPTTTTTTVPTTTTTVPTTTTTERTTTTTEPTTTTTTIPTTTTTTTIPTSTRAINVYGTNQDAGRYEEVPA